MEIAVKDLGKQFKDEWIFKALNYQFKSSNIYAITGPNGSGKSTLLQVLSGFLPQTSGELIFTFQQKKVATEDIYRYISVATPYTELIEEFTALELLEFHFKFKKIRKGLEPEEFLPKIHLTGTENKLIQNFSSGMKQRLKLGLAFYADSPIILLDEPTSNLDQSGINWYQSLLSECKDKLVVIASNQEYEYALCDKKLNIQDYKKDISSSPTIIR